MFGTVARNVKDAALSRALRSLLNDRFREFGQVTDCEIESEERRLMIQALLDGEREPIMATIERFELVKEGKDTLIVLHQFSCSRAWLATLLTRLFSGKRYPLPGAVAALL